MLALNEGSVTGAHFKLISPCVMTKAIVIAGSSPAVSTTDILIMMLLIIVAKFLLLIARVE